MIAYQGSFPAQTFSLGTKVGGSLGSNSAASLNWNANLGVNFSFPQFDASTGILTAVAIDFAGAVGGSADILFANSQLQPFNISGIVFRLTTNVTFSNQTFSASSADTKILTNSVTATSSSTPFNLSVGSTALNGPLTIMPLNASYIGSGNVILPMDVNFVASATTSNGSFAVTPFPTIAIQSARILYEFTPIPEPAPSLMLFSTIAVCALRRRFRLSTN